MNVGTILAPIDDSEHSTPALQHRSSPEPRPGKPWPTVPCCWRRRAGHAQHRWGRHFGEPDHGPMETYRTVAVASATPRSSLHRTSRGPKGLKR